MKITIQATNEMFFVIDTNNVFITIYINHVPFVMHKDLLIDILKSYETRRPNKSIARRSRRRKDGAMSKMPASNNADIGTIEPRRPKTIF